MHLRTSLAGALVVAFAGAPAHADPPGEVTPAPTQVDAAPRKSPALALGLSLGATTLGGVLMFAVDRHKPDPVEFALGAAVAYVGPSIGRWYGGGSAAVGLVARAVGGVLIVNGLVKDYPIDGCAEDEPGECDAHDQAVADHDRVVKRWVYSGAAIWVAATVYDIVRAPLDAREFNRAHAITVAPTVMPAGQGGALAPGVAVSGQF